MEYVGPTDTVPDVPNNIPVRNKGSYKNVVLLNQPTSMLRVRLPDGRVKKMAVKKVVRLKHWHRCRAMYNRYDRVLTFKFSFDLEATPEGSFRFGADSIDQDMNALAQLKAQVKSYNHQLTAVQQDIIFTRDSMRNSIDRVKYKVRAIKEQRDDSLPFEGLREQLLKSPDIIDVERVVTVERGAALKVTFLGPVMESGNYSPPRIVPLPPLQVMFYTTGDIRGGDLCIHPHISPGNVCYGNAVDTIDNAKRNMDIYLAVDIMREFRFGLSDSLLVRSWQTYAWNWWCRVMSEGIDNPDQHPWFPSWRDGGMSVVVNDNGVHEVKSVFEVLGVESGEQAFSEFHRGLSLLWYKPGTYDQPFLYGRRGAIVGDARCNCGASIIDETPAGTLSCACHSAHSYLKCAVCALPLSSCRCPWQTHAQWLATTPGNNLYCEASTCGVAGARQDPPVPMFQFTTSNGGSAVATYHGPRVVCLTHLPDDGTPVPVYIAPCPQCGSRHAHPDDHPCYWCGRSALRHLGATFQCYADQPERFRPQHDRYSEYSEADAAMLYATLLGDGEEEPQTDAPVSGALVRDCAFCGVSWEYLVDGEPGLTCPSCERCNCEDCINATDEDEDEGPREEEGPEELDLEPARATN